MGVRIWVASLNDLIPTETRCHLSAEELRRAEAVASALRRERFLARRSMVRAVLARETGIDADELALGRRCLQGPGGEVWWSASSSGGMAALALAPCRIGLDLERRRERRRWDRIASRYFGERESREAAGSPTRFLELWTLKEAYLKALGVGLAGGLRSLDCSALEPIGDGWSRGDPHPGWRFGNLDLDPGLVAGVAVEEAPDRIEVRAWTDESPPPGEPS